jgi:hypothetical protein
VFRRRFDGRGRFARLKREAIAGPFSPPGKTMHLVVFIELIGC